MTAKFSADLYPCEVVIKTAYVLTEKYYVHLDLQDNMYHISIKSKNDESDIEIENKLNEEIIAQLARYTVAVRTSEIRQLIMGRAFSSSMIVKEKTAPEYNDEYVSSAASILRDWFEAHEK